MARKHPLEQLKKKIKQMEDYLGPRIDYNMDNWPMHLPDRWIMEYCMLLKERYYKSLRGKWKKKK